MPPLFGLLLFTFFSSCSTMPTDMRTLVPADSLVYLETNDLAAALQPIIDSKPFTEIAKSKPDFSALKGVQLAVAVTGFETTEEKLTDETSVGRVQPRFVAVADTHAWNYQTVAFADQKLGQFVTDIYGADVTQDRVEKNGGDYFTWTSNDGRKSFALVIDSIIYFGNDESAIDKSLAVKRGETDSIAKTGKVPPSDPKTLASGYVSTDGVAQIANIVGLKFASDIGEGSEVQSAIAGILPQLIRNTITEITWTSTRTEQGIDDKYQISMPPDIAGVFSETLVISEDSDANTRVNNMLLAQVPSNIHSAARYNIKNPQVAWRSIVLVAQKELDLVGSRILAEIAALLFEPYGISDPELFLSSLGSEPQSSRNIVTAQLAPESDETIVIARRGIDQATIKSLSPDLKAPKNIVEGGPNVWSTADNSLQVAFDGDWIKIGSQENLALANGSRLGEIGEIKSGSLRTLAVSKATVTTLGTNNALASQIAEMLSETKSDNARAKSTYITETRFTKTGMERRTISDFGLIGSIIAQLAENQ